MSFPFQVVYPYAMAIDANSFKEAVKQYAKYNDNMNINSMILTDQYNQAMKARLQYYKDGAKNKVQISMQPTIWPMKADASGNLAPNFWPYAPEITYDTKEIPATKWLDTSSFVPKIIPIQTVGSPYATMGLMGMGSMGLGSMGLGSMGLGSMGIRAMY